jgi:hypothetical protein
MSPQVGAEIQELRGCALLGSVTSNLKVATHDLVPTSDQLGGHVPGLPVPDGVLISDNDDDVFYL